MKNEFREQISFGCFVGKEEFYLTGLKEELGRELGLMIDQEMGNLSECAVKIPASGQHQDI